MVITNVFVRIYSAFSSFARITNHIVAIVLIIFLKGEINMKIKWYGYVFLPETAEQANKIAHWLSYRGIGFRVGTTAGKGRPCVDVVLNWFELMLLYLACGRVHYLKNVNMYVLKEVA